MARIPPPISAALALVLLAGLAGGHTVPDALSGRLGFGPGRLEGAVPAGSEATFRATLAALDDLGVRPERVVLRDGRRELILDLYPREGEQPRDNLALLGVGDNDLRDLFSRHKIPIHLAGPRPPGVPEQWGYDPMALSYEGKAADGRAVRVEVWARRFDHPDHARDDETTVKVVADWTGGEAWGRSVFEKVDARLGLGKNEDKDEARPATPADPKPNQEAH